MAEVRRFVFPIGLWLAAQTSAALAIQSIPPGQPALFEPSGAWTIETTEATCLVGRKFGEGDQQVTLGFRRVPATKHIRIAIWVSGPAAKTARGYASLRLDEAPSTTAPFSKGPVNLKGLQLYAIDVPRDEFPGIESAKRLHVMAADLDKAFALRGIGGAFAALANCENDLLASWGMDPAVLASIKAGARLKNPFGLFSTNDYPSEALAKHQQGISNVRLLIGVDGRARYCGVVESSGSKALDAKTCEIYVKRARYEPARDASGEAVPSFYFQRMSWGIPE